MSQPPTAVDRVLKLTVASVIFLFFIAPVLTLMLKFSAWTAMMDTPRLDLSSTSEKIQTGVSVSEIKALDEKLQGLTAYAGEAKGSAEILQFVVVEFDESAPQNVQDAFRPVSLDLTNGEQTAVVVMSNRPTRWRVTVPETYYRARFAVENASPFDLEDAPKGLLAGYKVTEFSGGKAAAPHQYTEGQDRQPFCDAITDWLKLYGVRWSKARLTAVRNPTTITMSPYGVIDDGSVLHGLPNLYSFCSR